VRVLRALTWAVGQLLGSVCESVSGRTRDRTRKPAQEPIPEPHRLMWLSSGSDAEAAQGIPAARAGRSRSSGVDMVTRSFLAVLSHVDGVWGEPTAAPRQGAPQPRHAAFPNPEPREDADHAAWPVRDGPT